MKSTLPHMARPPLKSLTSVRTVAKFYAYEALEENITRRLFSGPDERASWLLDKAKKPPALARVIAHVKSAYSGAVSSEVIDVKARFNKNCGCSSCPCSPGFDIQVVVPRVLAFRYDVPRESCARYHEDKTGAITRNRTEVV